MEVRRHTDRVTSGCGRPAGRTDLDELSDLCWAQPQPHAPQRVPELAVVEAATPIGVEQCEDLRCVAHQLAVDLALPPNQLVEHCRHRIRLALQHLLAAEPVRL
jgi:hypothetical protein